MTWATIEVAESPLKTSIRTRHGNSSWDTQAWLPQLVGKPNPDPLQRDLRGALADLDRLFDLREAIEEICLTNGLTAFAVTGARFADRLCWEALPLLFKHSERRPLFAPVRVRDAGSPWRPERPGDKLRAVFLVGHPGSSTAFTFDTIRTLVGQIFSSLAPAQRKLVEAPDAPTVINIADADRSVWVAALAAARPHLVVYFGHGESAPVPRLQTSLKQWTPLAELADDITKSGASFPPFWSFVACSLGETNPSGSGPTIHGPAAFDILAAHGAVSMVAMRSPIRVSIATIFLADYLAQFLGGLAPELAAAGARQTAFASERGGLSAPQDWAAAAVWSVAVPLERLEWGVGGEAARRTDFALRLLRTTSRAPAIGLDELDAAVATRAENWSQQRRVRILPSAGQVRVPTAEFTGLLESARRVLGAFPILIDAGEGGASYSGRLKHWAVDLRKSLMPATDEPIFATAIANLASGSEDGLKGLLAFPKAFVVFMTPPSADDAIWDTIQAAPDDATIVIVQPDEVSGLPSDGWFKDTIVRDEADPDTVIVEALAQRPKSIALLAALRRPIRPSDLAAISGEPAIVPDGVLVRREAGSGLALADRFRDKATADVGQSAMRAAHRDLAAYLANAGQSSLAWGDLAILHHLANAALWPELAEGVNAMVVHGPTEVDWLALARVLANLPPAATGLIHPEVFIDLAQAFIDLQDLETAGHWLDRASPQHNLDKARRAGLLSEVWKGRREEGAQQEMWSEAQAAVKFCQAELTEEPSSARAAAELRRHQLQLARLMLYFLSDATEARAALERLITELESENPVTAAHALCAARRNLAECLFEFAPFRGPEHQAIAATLLADAAAVSLSHHLHEVRCDVLYSQAKLSEVRGDITSALGFLSTCATEAKAIGYEVAFRIADARRYWLEILRQGRSWDAASYRGYQQPLDFLDWHLWSVRYAAHGRLLGAKRLAASGNVDAACAALERTVQLFSARAILSGKSDQTTLVRSAAGLAVLGSPRAWTEISKHLDLKQWSERDADELWGQVP